MKRKNIFMGTVVVLALGLVGGFAFAQTNNTEIGRIQNQPNTGFNTTEGNHCSNNQEMIQAMKDNGFDEIAAYMENGDYEAMNEWMNNLTDEDYDKMLNIMQENGHGMMVKMMESMSKEDMINMHNSMMGNKGSTNMMNNMMKRNNLQ